jgi:ABC-type uncharacterized transport system permease subunit
MDTKQELTELANHVKAYLETKGELVRLTAIEKSARTLSSVAARFIPVQLFLFVILFGSFALVNLMQEQTGREDLAYLSVALLYLLITLVYILFFKRRLQKKLNDAFIDKMLNDEQDK